MKIQCLQRSFLAAVAAIAFSTGRVAAQDSATTTAQPAAASQPAPQLSHGVPQVLQLVQAKVSDGIIVNYIQNSGTIYPLSANEIVYLKQQGVSDTVMNAMLNQRSRLTGSTEPATTTVAATTAANASPTNAGGQTYVAAAPAVAYVQPAQSSTVYVIPDTQTYRYNAWYYGATPYYYYPYPYYGGYYYGWPAVSLSFGWGNYHYSGGGYHYYGGGYHGGYNGGWHGGGGGSYHGGGGGYHGGGGGGGWHSGGGGHR